MRLLIERKYVSAVSGLFLYLFLLVHLYDNLYIFAGEQAFNLKAKELLANPLIRIMEVVLLIAFLYHIVEGIIVSFRNAQARPRRYTVYHQQNTLVSRTMWLSGAVILMFLVIHLRTFFVPYRIEGSVTSLYREVVAAFSNPYYSLLYLACFVFLGMHLSHALQSAFQTLGFWHPQWTGRLRVLSAALAWLVVLGYASIPVSVLLGLVN